MNPAALKAALRGDISNAITASTPGGIEKQEKAGQMALVKSTNMPKKLSPSREAFEALGFTFGDAVDDLFVKATLPAGWTRAATGHSMHSDILDEKGRKRVGVFYKAAFYDRSADAHLVARFRVTVKYPEGDAAAASDAVLPMIVEDAGVEIHRVGEVGRRDWDARERLEKEGYAWLDANRPGWDDSAASWKI